MVGAATAGRSGTVGRRLGKYARLSLLDAPGLIIEWSRRWEWAVLGPLFAENVFDDLFPDLDQPFPEVRAMIGNGDRGGFLEQQGRFHMLVDLPCDNLQKVDRMSMAHGLEVRVPMLSNVMLEFAGHLPVSMRKRGQRTKEPLRTIAETLAPTLARPAAKRGFGFPLEAWLRGDLARRWREWELSSRLAIIGFAPTGLDKLVEQYTAAARVEDIYRAETLAARLFDLMLLALWIEKHQVRS